MSEYLGPEEVANGVEQITSATPTKDRKPQTMPGLQDHQLDQPLKQGDACFVAGRSTVDQIFDCIAIIAKHLEHQRNLYHEFIDFKKAPDIVCHDGLIGGKIDGGIVQVARALCDHPSCELFWTIICR